MPKLFESRVSASAVGGPQQSRVQQTPQQRSQVPMVAAEAFSGAVDIVQKKWEASEISNLTTQLTDFQSKMELRYKEHLKGAIPDGNDGIIEKPGGDTWDNQFIEEFDAGLKGIGEGVSSNKAQMIYNQEYAKINAGFTERIAAGREAVSQKKTEMKVNKMLQDNSVRAFNNPQGFGLVESDLRSSLQHLTDAGLLSPIAAEEIFQEKKNVLAESALLGQIQTNHYKAQQELKAGKWDPYLDGPKKAKFLNEIDNLVRADKARAEVDDRLRMTDTHQYYQKRGQHPGRMNTEEITPENAVKRMEFVKGARANSRNQSMPFFDETETLEVQNRWKTARPENVVEEMIGWSQNIAHPEILYEMSKSVAEKDPEMGVVLQTATQDKAAALGILRGQRIVEEGAIDVPEKSEFQNEFSSYVPPDLFGNAGGPQFYSGLFEAARNLYIAEEVKSGKKNTSNFNSTGFRQAVNRIIGPKVEVSGQEIPQFRSERKEPGVVGDWVGQDRIDEMTDIFRRPEDMQKYLYQMRGNGTKDFLGEPHLINGKNAQIHKEPNAIKFEVVADGQYRLWFKGQMLRRKGFDPRDPRSDYIVNLKQLDKDGYGIGDKKRSKYDQTQMDIVESTIGVRF